MSAWPGPGRGVGEAKLQQGMRGRVGISWYVGGGGGGGGGQRQRPGVIMRVDAEVRGVSFVGSRRGGVEQWLRKKMQQPADLPWGSLSVKHLTF